MRPGDDMRKNELAADTIDGFSPGFNGGFDGGNVTLHHNRYVASADVHPCANPRSPVELDGKPLIIGGTDEVTPPSSTAS